MRQTSETKEEVYDAQISPLMKQIIAICLEHKIAHLLGFTLNKEEGLCCITANVTDDFEPEDRLVDAHSVLYRDANQPAVMLTTRDKDGHVTNMTAILP